MPRFWVKIGDKRIEAESIGELIKAVAEELISQGVVSRDKAYNRCIAAEHGLLDAKAVERFCNAVARIADVELLMEDPGIPLIFIEDEPDDEEEEPLIDVEDELGEEDEELFYDEDMEWE